MHVFIIRNRCYTLCSVTFQVIKGPVGALTMQDLIHTYTNDFIMGVLLY